MWLGACPISTSNFNENIVLPREALAKRESFVDDPSR